MTSSEAKCDLLLKDCKTRHFLLFWLTVTECQSRWIIPSVQTEAIVFIKEQTYVGEWNVERFKGTMKARRWIVQKEAPMCRRGHGRKGGKEKERAFRHQSTSRYPSLTLCFLGLFLSACLLPLFEHFWF